ncbi:MAG: FAD/NAD(P)-binding protein [Armatimonadota bacterium]
MSDVLIPKEAVIQKIKPQTYDTTTYTLSFVNPEDREAYSFAPGQFNMISVFGFGEAPISISSGPNGNGTFDHTVRAVGNLTKALTRMREGDVVGVRGPYGSQWPVDEAKGKDILVVAGGIGLAPLRPFIMEVFRNRSEYGRLEICYGARTPQDLLFTDEFEQWRSVPDTLVRVTVDRAPDGDWQGNVGVVTTLFTDLSVGPSNTIALLCGPDIMMRFGVLDLLKRHYAPEAIFVSLERRMKCGVGMCGHCQCGPFFVCQDGPVFRYSDIQNVVESMV